jgi:hypothetical protein
MGLDNKTYWLTDWLTVSRNVTLTLIRSVMTSVCPTWEYEADAHLLKLQRLQNRVLRAAGNLDRWAPARELHEALQIPYVYNYTTKYCRTQAEVILNHVNPNVRGIGQGEARHKNYRRVKLGGGQAYDRSAE